MLPGRPLRRRRSPERAGSGWRRSAPNRSDTPHGRPRLRPGAYSNLDNFLPGVDSGSRDSTCRWRHRREIHAADMPRRAQLGQAQPRGATEDLRGYRRALRRAHLAGPVSGRLSAAPVVIGDERPGARRQAPRDRRAVRGDPRAARRLHDRRRQGPRCSHRRRRTHSIGPHEHRRNPAGEGRAAIMTHALWIVQGLLAALFLFAGGMKLVLPLDKLTGPFPLPGWFIRFIGVCEVLGALGLILPGLFRIRRGLTPLAAAGLVIIMIGATVITLIGGDLMAAVISLIVGLLAAFVAYGRWRLVPLHGASRPSRLRPAS